MNELPFKDVKFSNMIGQQYYGRTRDGETITGYIWGFGNSEGYKGPYTLITSENPGPMLETTQNPIVIDSQATWEKNDSGYTFTLPNGDVYAIGVRCMHCMRPS